MFSVKKCETQRTRHLPCCRLHISRISRRVSFDGLFYLLLQSQKQAAIRKQILRQGLLYLLQYLRQNEGEYMKEKMAVRYNLNLGLQAQFTLYRNYHDKKSYHFCFVYSQPWTRP
jgi:hypothetical protein